MNRRALGARDVFWTPAIGAVVYSKLLPQQSAGD